MSEMSVAAELLLRLEGFDELIAGAIESGNWECLNSLLTNRQLMLEQVCSLPLQEHERKLAVNRMVLMQDADRCFMAAVHTQKQALQKQVASLVHERKAIQAYQSD